MTAPHTNYQKGKRVRIALHSGTVIIDNMRTPIPQKKPKPKKPKLYKCANKPSCGNLFEKRRMSHVACSTLCAITIGEKKSAEKKRRARIEEKKADKEKLYSLLPIRKLLAKAQPFFNTFIRLRDADKNCISCGRPYRMGKAGAFTGGDYDAGHFRSIGSAEHLRFNEDNCHGQCKHCNGPFGQGNHIDYRNGLIDRITVERVEALESNNTIVHWTREMIFMIMKTYQAKASALRKERKCMS